MQAGKASATAMAAARHRAAHQVLEGGRIFADPLALRIAGIEAGDIPPDTPGARGMRVFIAVRTRFAEDALAAAVVRGARQLAVLGAGLDTFAYRSPFADALRIFEVDHPDTQAWKRERLAAAAIAVPQWLTFVPVDFERQALFAALAAAGFDRALPTFFLWLGVVPYLTAEATWSTLEAIAGLGSGTHVAFDYSNPPDERSEIERAAHARRAARVAALGEPWKQFFVTGELHARLRALGFAEIEDLGPRQMAQRYFPGRAETARDSGGHTIHAAVH